MSDDATAAEGEKTVQQWTRDLDSRRLDGETRAWHDLMIRLDDTDAIKLSPERKILEELKLLGFDEVLVSQTENGHVVAASVDLELGSVTATRDGGQIAIEIYEGVRGTDINLGGDDYSPLLVADFHENAWVVLERYFAAKSDFCDPNPEV